MFHIQIKVVYTLYGLLLYLFNGLKSILRWAFKLKNYFLKNFRDMDIEEFITPLYLSLSWL
jgi:hypothetical protein